MGRTGGGSCKRALPLKRLAQELYWHGFRKPRARRSKTGADLFALLTVRLMTAFIVLHIFEILLWAAFYRWLCFPLWESAFYFSTSSYATVGYGDIVLPQMWRTLGPLESIIGVLMCGLSASFLFAIVSRLVDRETKLSREPAKPHRAYIDGETIPTS